MSTDHDRPRSGYVNGMPFIPPKLNDYQLRLKAKLDACAGSDRAAAQVANDSGQAPSSTSDKVDQVAEVVHADADAPEQTSAKGASANSPAADTPMNQSPVGGKIIHYPKPNPKGPSSDGTTSDAVSGEAVVAEKGMTEEILRGALLAADKLDEIQIPVREDLCGTWMKQGDLGFLFGERGLGKTWLALYIARSLAEGANIGPWPVTKRRRVLYVDGEMPLDGMRQRDGSLRRSGGELFVLNHEHLFQAANCVLNLSGIMTQKALFDLCVHQQFEVLVIDNLSCLFSGIAENDADSWELVLPWLLDLRRHKIAVIIVHHANRGGQHMRGTSKREDAAFWVLRLDSVPDHSRETEGARFVSRFTKSRQGTREELEPLDWEFQPDGDSTRVTFRALPTLQVFKQWVRDGLTSCSDIAEEMGISRGQVSKLAKRGETEGWLKIENRTYKLVGASS